MYKRTEKPTYKPNNHFQKKRNQHFSENNARLTENVPIRLNRYIANSGICSRREADEYIRAGLVSVNGKRLTEFGTKVLPGDKVCFDGKMIIPERKVYILLNKPKDYISTCDDPHAGRTVMELIKRACRERVYPVGRLDRNTTGVLLLTNDGELAKKLLHPKYNKKKIYQVSLAQNLKPADMEKIVNGIEMEDGIIMADAVIYSVPDDKKQVNIEFHSGKNHIVHRIFENFGYEVKKLDRIYFAGLTKRNLERGKWRFLTAKEISMLKMGAFE